MMKAVAGEISAVVVRLPEMLDIGVQDTLNLSYFGVVIQGLLLALFREEEGWINAAIVDEMNGQPTLATYHLLASDKQRRIDLPVDGRRWARISVEQWQDFCIDGQPGWIEAHPRRFLTLAKAG